MNAATLAALAAFPGQLDGFFSAIPKSHVRWSPPTWDGIPSESFNPIEQICHVRDIEIDGYQVRFQRTLSEDNPRLATIDGYALAKERGYGQADPHEVLASIRVARARTIQLLAALKPADFERPAIFEDYGALTLRSLVHLLSSHDQQHLAGLQWLLAKIAMARVDTHVPADTGA